MTPQVTIIDPTHPFFGRTFPLVRRNSPDGQPHVILLLPNGQHRQVRQTMTDFEVNSVALQPAPARPHLPVISVRTILPLARLVKTKIRAGEEKFYEPSAPGDSQGSRLVAEQAPQPPTEGVASPDDPSTSAPGPAPGLPHSALSSSTPEGGQA